MIDIVVGFVICCAIIGLVFACVIICGIVARVGGVLDRCVVRCFGSVFVSISLVCCGLGFFIIRLYGLGLLILSMLKILLNYFSSHTQALIIQI
jgi:hypothetical protein